MLYLLKLIFLRKTNLLYKGLAGNRLKMYAATTKHTVVEEFLFLKLEG